MHSGGFQIWSPHNCTLGFKNETSAQPLQLSSSCTLLCIQRCTAGAGKKSVHTIGAAVWAVPSPSTTHLAGSLATLHRSFSSPLPSLGTIGLRSSENEALQRARAEAAPASLPESLDVVLSVPQATPWLVLETQQAHFLDRSACNCPRTSLPSKLHERVGNANPAGGFPGRPMYHLRLGPVLYAPTWKFLFTRQSVMPAETAIACAVGRDVVNSEVVVDPVSEDNIQASADHVAEATAAADQEALAVLFPAFHHGRYFANRHEFAQHCLYSDEHLLWCEDEPLIMAEWGAEEMIVMNLSVPSPARDEQDRLESEAVGCWVGTVKDEGKAVPRSVSSHLRTSRKRRRVWLDAQLSPVDAQVELETERCLVTIPQALPIEKGHLQSCCALGAFVRTARSGHHEAPCVYVLELPADHETAAEPVVAHTTGPPQLSSQSTQDSDNENDGFAEWYALLRAASRVECASVTDSLSVCTRVSQTPPVTKKAVAELILHGIVSSLALWCFQHQTHRFTTSAVENVKVIASLLLDWWHHLTKEARQAATAAASQSTQANRSRIALLIFVAFQQLPVAEDLLSPPLPIVSSRGVIPPTHQTQPSHSAGATPAFFASLAVSCAAAVTRHLRRADQAGSWCTPTSRTHASGRRGHILNEGHTALSHPRRRTGSSQSASDASDVDQDPASPSFSSVPAANRRGVLRRLSAEETFHRREDYQACMNLMVQLLFAEQHAVLTSAVGHIP